MVNIDLNYIVYDANIRIYFYIASDIFQKMMYSNEKGSMTNAPFSVVWVIQFIG